MVKVKTIASIPVSQATALISLGSQQANQIGIMKSFAEFSTLDLSSYKIQKLNWGTFPSLYQFYQYLVAPFIENTWKDFVPYTRDGVELYSGLPDPQQGRIVPGTQLYARSVDNNSLIIKNIDPQTLFVGIVNDSFMYDACLIKYDPMDPDYPNQDKNGIAFTSVYKVIKSYSFTDEKYVIFAAGYLHYQIITITVHTDQNGRHCVGKIKTLKSLPVPKTVWPKWENDKLQSFPKVDQIIPIDLDPINQEKLQLLKLYTNSQGNWVMKRYTYDLDTHDFNESSNEIQNPINYYVTDYHIENLEKTRMLCGGKLLILDRNELGEYELNFFNICDVEKDYRSCSDQPVFEYNAFVPYNTVGSHVVCGPKKAAVLIETIEKDFVVKEIATTYNYYGLISNVFLYTQNGSDRIFILSSDFKCNRSTIDTYEICTDDPSDPPNH